MNGPNKTLHPPHAADGSRDAGAKRSPPPEVFRALEYARDHDPHPVVRNIAKWYTPGGPRYERLAPKLERKQRSAD